MKRQVGERPTFGKPSGGTSVGAMRERSGLERPAEPPADHDHDHANGHYAAIFESEEELYATTIPFIEQGLDGDERCLYVVHDDAERADVVEALRESDVAVEEALRSGDLVFRTVEETYHRTEPFDPDEMLTFYEAVIEETLAEYEGLRVVAGTNWIEDVSLDDFMEYEGRVNALFDETDAQALCYYDRTELSSDVIHDVVQTHPHLIYEGHVCDNFYYVPPSELLGPEGTDKRADRMLQTVRDRTRAKTRLAAHRRLLQELNEIMATPDRSFETKLQSLFELGCEWFDMELGGLNRVDYEQDRFEVEYLNGEHDYFEPGKEIPLSETYCRAPAEAKDTASVSDPTDGGFDNIAVYEEHGAKAYIGTYISIEGGEDRTFAFISSEPRQTPFTEADRTHIELMARWIKYEVERRQRETELRRIFESSQDAIFIFDPVADEMLRTNPAGCELLGYTEQELLSRGPSEFHPDGIEQFRAFVNDVYEQGHGWTDELVCTRKDGRHVPVEISASPIAYDGRECLLAMVRDISERKEHERAQRRLYEIAADPDTAFEEKLQSMFELGCERFDMKLGGLATVDPENDRFRVDFTSADHEHLEPGAECRLSETYCLKTALKKDTCAVVDPQEYDGKLCYDQFGARAYLGTYLEFEGAKDRTFWFVSDEEHDPFTEDQRTFHHLMGQWLRYELERRQTTDQLAALNRLNEVARDVNRELVRQSTREDIEAAVCDRLAGSDSYEFAWVGTIEDDEIVPTTSAKDRGYLDDIEVPLDDPEREGPTARAATTGETQVVRSVEDDPGYEPWCEEVRERDVAATAAIPVAYEDRIYGVLNVYTSRERAFDADEQEVIGHLGEIMGLAIAAIEHGHELAHERERLSFINSLLRHNLLNNLNVVDARAGLLDPSDEEGREHVEIIRDYTQEMADLIDTLRTLMEGLIEEEHEPEPVHVGEILHQEVDQVDHAYADAEFHVAGGADRDVEVMADGLLGEVFQNLLVNAVQHNDKDVPRVVADVTAGEDHVTVDVADNGPGIPEGLENQLFEKGEKGLQSQGTGYGLHLVSEIIELYDGEITVENRDPAGAVFSVTFPRA